MTTATSALDIAEIRGIGDARHRVAWAGTVIVSADSHWLEGDIWVDRFPAHLKDRAPRMFFENGGYQLVVDVKSMMPSEVAECFCAFECVSGFNNVEARMKDRDAEGVSKEILFPQRTLGMNRLEDLEYREWCSCAYNQHLSEVYAQQPNRLYGVAVLKWWDPERTRDALADIKDLGFKMALVPISPGEHADGEPVQYNSERMEPFWAAIEESGLPICYHIGENSKAGGRGIAGIFVMEQMGSMRNI